MWKESRDEQLFHPKRWVQHDLALLCQRLSLADLGNLLVALVGLEAEQGLQTIAMPASSSALAFLLAMENRDVRTKVAMCG
jgi:hypothetical protein